MVTILLLILLTLFGARVSSPNIAITETTPEVTDCAVQSPETASATDSCRPATPVAAASPVASDCTVPPRTVGGVNEIASTAITPVPGTPTLDEAIPYVKPEGTPASGQAIEGVTATIEQFIACANAGEYLRTLALFSDDFIRSYAGDIGVPLAEDDPLLVPSPAPADDRALIDEITDVIELPDGRVSLLATFAIADDSEEPVKVAFTLAYDQDRERWLIDDFREVLPEDGPNAWTLVQGEGYEGVIVPEDSAEEFADLFISEPVDGFWTPTEDDIAALEEDLPSYLQTMAAVTAGLSADFIDRLPDYKRQYAGFVQGGRNLILVNATCAGDDLQWRTRVVFVMDGGDCFFRVTYDPASGSFTGFEVNGQA